MGFQKFGDQQPIEVEGQEHVTAQKLAWTKQDEDELAAENSDQED